jgi:hypothetical protein
MVVFCIFDTATLLCSAIIHDRDHVLPHREEAKNVIESSLDMLHQLSLTTKLGATSYNFLFKLAQATPELSGNTPASKRQRQASSSVPTTTPPTHAPASAPASAAVVSSTEVPLDPIIEPADSSTVDTLPLMAMPDDLSFDIDQFLAQNPFGSVGNPSALDMGGMEQIWDWENLHLDVYAQVDGEHGWDVPGEGSG